MVTEYDKQEDGLELDFVLKDTDIIPFRCVNYNPFVVKNLINYRFHRLRILVSGLSRLQIFVKPCLIIDHGFTDICH